LSWYSFHDHLQPPEHRVKASAFSSLAQSDLIDGV
jgi:hypothetical protein